MLLRSLKLVNFRQYKGVQKISFSCDPDKNVTIILGNNTFGKTTLLQAFYWCFYQHVNLDNPENLLNYDIMWAMQEGDEEEVLVEVELMHGGLEYTITTTQNYRMINGEINRSKVKTEIGYIGDDGGLEPVKGAKVESVIKSILPEDLSDYFFFDTERVEKISEKKDLTESVRGLLGLKPLDNAIKHIGYKSQKRTVLGKLYEQLDLAGDEKARRALEEIQAAQDRLDEIASELATCSDQIDAYTERKEELDAILRDNESTTKLQHRKEELEGKVDLDEGLVKSNAKGMRQTLGSTSVHYFAVPLIEQAEKMLAEADLSDKGIKDLTRATLEDIIANRDTCICGLRFADHPDAVEHIRQEMKFCPPESIGNAVRRYRDDLAVFGADLDDVFEAINISWGNIAAAKIRIQNAVDEINEISDKIAGKEDGKNLEIELKSIKQRLKDLNDDLVRLNREEVTKHGVIKANREIYDAHALTSEKNAETLMLIRYAEEIKSWLTDTYARKETETREALEEQVNSLFARMYHGKRRVKIDQKYQVHLLTMGIDDEQETGESGGLNSVKNFAFIAGLVSLAKRKAQSSPSDDIDAVKLQPYPLVMDAPFSKADEIHTANISEVLPEASEQVVMFVMHKDWQHAEKVLQDRVGAQYELDKYSEQHSCLKEL